MFKLKNVIILLIVMQIQSAYVYFKYDVKSKNEQRNTETTLSGEIEGENKNKTHFNNSPEINNEIANSGKEIIENTVKEGEDYIGENKKPHHTTNIYTENFMSGIIYSGFLTNNFFK